MAKSNIFGLDGFPFVTVDCHLKEGDDIKVDDAVYIVQKCDPITREDQLQNVYVKKAFH